MTEVKDILFGETILSEEEKKQVYKDIQKYINGKDYEKLIEWGKSKGDELLIQIRKEIKERDKTEVIKSKLDHLIDYIDFLEQLKGQIDNSKGGEIIKQNIDTDIKLANDNIEIRVDVKNDFFDIPVYTKADMLKMKRGDFMTIDKKIAEYLNTYYVQKEEKVNKMHPYED